MDMLAEHVVKVDHHLCDSSGFTYPEELRAFTISYPGKIIILFNSNTLCKQSVFDRGAAEMFFAVGSDVSTVFAADFVQSRGHLP
jgi:hypothetical protein